MRRVDNNLVVGNRRFKSLFSVPAIYYYDSGPLGYPFTSYRIFINSREECLEICGILNRDGIDFRFAIDSRSTKKETLWFNPIYQKKFFNLEDLENKCWILDLECETERFIKFIVSLREYNYKYCYCLLNKPGYGIIL